MASITTSQPTPSKICPSVQQAIIDNKTTIQCLFSGIVPESAISFLTGNQPPSKFVAISQSMTHFMKMTLQACTAFLIMQKMVSITKAEPVKDEKLKMEIGAERKLSPKELEVLGASLSSGAEARAFEEMVDNEIPTRFDQPAGIVATVAIKRLAEATVKKEVDFSGGNTLLSYFMYSATEIDLDPTSANAMALASAMIAQATIKTPKATGIVKVPITLKSGEVRNHTMTDGDAFFAGAGQRIMKVCVTGNEKAAAPEEINKIEVTRVEVQLGAQRIFGGEDVPIGEAFGLGRKYADYMIHSNKFPVAKPNATIKQ